MAHYNHPTMKPGNGRKIVVAMSGGVDSSVAALLLREQGWDVVGCFMRLGSEFEPEGFAADPDTACDLEPAQGRSNKQGCCSVNDAADARRVCALLDMPLYVLNFRRDFGRIVDYFVSEYNAGRTPNPCVRCNDWLKFGKLIDYAASIDADAIATGHYARVDHTGHEPKLLRGVDEHKDQSYVLFGVKRGRLQRMHLPIGAYRKPEIRAIAEEHALPVFNKPDSQEICFVPDNDYAGLVRRRSPEAVEAGRIVDTAGRDLGEHPGHQHYTIGQRRGLSVSLGHPIYVVEKDAETNTVVVGDADEILADGLEADQTNWLIDPPTESVTCSVKVRSNSDPVPATLDVVGDDRMRVRFEEPIRAVSPGQAAVCYVGERCIGGGWIAEATSSRR